MEEVLDTVRSQLRPSHGPGLNSEGAYRRGSQERVSDLNLSLCPATPATTLTVISPFQSEPWGYHRFEVAIHVAEMPAGITSNQFYFHRLLCTH